jgi:hypothetical protein
MSPPRGHHLDHGYYFVIAVEPLGSALIATQVPDQNIRIDQHQPKFRG